MENLLKNFIDEIIEQNGLKVASDDVIKLVTEEAKKLAQERTGSNTSSYLSDDEVYEIVMNSPALLAEKKKKEPKADTKKMVEKVKTSRNSAKDLIAKANGEQLSLDLFDEVEDDDDEDFEYEG